MKGLVIVGAGGHGREVLQLVHDINGVKPQWQVLGFVDDAAVAVASGSVGGLPWLGSLDWLRERTCSVVVAIGAPSARRRVVRRLQALGVQAFACLVHPSAILGARVRVGDGTIVCAGAVLTTDITLGEHVIVNTAAVVSHDCSLADFATLAPRVTLAGAVSVAEGAEIGAAATVLQGVVVGAWARVGAGACVLKAVTMNETVVGVPARSVRMREQNWQDI